MERGKIYIIGEYIAPDEFVTVRKRLLKNMKPRRPVTLAELYILFPNRLEHEVNRLRRRAYDSGEHGFSHAVINNEGTGI